MSPCGERKPGWRPNQGAGGSHEDVLSTRIALSQRACQPQAGGAAARRNPAGGGGRRRGVRNDKTHHSQLEMPSGRMAQVKKGGRRGTGPRPRHACSATGALPTRLAPGDTIHMNSKWAACGDWRLVNPGSGAALRGARCSARCCTTLTWASGPACSAASAARCWTSGHLSTRQACRSWALVGCA